MERIGSGGTILHFEFPKFIRVTLKSKYSHNNTRRKILFLFTKELAKLIAADLFFDRPRFYQLHAICYWTTLVSHMDEFWAIINRDSG
jgi:hypothetical protein